MAYIIGLILALYGVVDLFAGSAHRSLPWWGDLIAIAAGTVLALAAKLLDDD